MASPRAGRPQGINALSGITGHHLVELAAGLAVWSQGFHKVFLNATTQLHFWHFDNFFQNPRRSAVEAVKERGQLLLLFLLFLLLLLNKSWRIQPFEVTKCRQFQNFGQAETRV